MSRAWTPRRVADLEPAIRALSTQYLDALGGRTDVDLIGDYAALLPMDVISKLLGVPDGDQEQLRGWSDALLHRDEGVPDVTPEGIEAATQLYKYFCVFVADRRARHRAATTSPPRSSRPSRTAKHSPTIQVVGFCFLLIIAGNETTTKLLGNCLLAMQRFPSETTKVLDDPRRIPDAVEEILALRRFDAGDGAHVDPRRRTARRTHARRADKVLLLLGSANRDRTCGNGPTCSTSIARGRRITSGSGTASTCASVRRWRASRCA